MLNRGAGSVCVPVPILTPTPYWIDQWREIVTKNDLIAKQQLEIEVLKKRLQWARKDKADIVSALVCIGGPLNDNVDGFSVKQRSYLHSRILEPAENEDYEYIEG